MKIIVTSGGTEEPIDRVRSITNKSTGTLGRLIATGFAALGHTVYYLYNGHQPPTHPHLIPRQTTQLNDLDQAVTELLTTQHIDAFVHAMAVSDYHVSNPSANKISSTADTITITLQKNKKIIRMVKDLSPATLLFGFKLLVDTDDSHLRDVAYALLQKNQADYVIANDLSAICGSRHRAFLIDHTGHYTTHETKDEIAQAIISQTLLRRS